MCPGRRSPVSSRDSSREKGGALVLGSLSAPTRIHSSPPRLLLRDPSATCIFGRPSTVTPPRPGRRVCALGGAL